MNALVVPLTLVFHRIIIHATTFTFLELSVHAALRILSLMLFALPWAPTAAACLLGDNYDSSSSPVRIELLEEIDELRELVESEEELEDGLAHLVCATLVDSSAEFVRNLRSNSLCSARTKQNPARGPPSL